MLPVVIGENEEAGEDWGVDGIPDGDEVAGGSKDGAGEVKFSTCVVGVK